MMMSLPVAGAMAEDWLGCVVSIDCGLTSGVYRGEVCAVDPNRQTISVRRPSHNGVCCPVPHVTFSAIDIKELKILEFGNGSDPTSSSSSSSSPHSRNGSHAVTSPSVTLLRKGCQGSKGTQQPVRRRAELKNITGGPQEGLRMQVMDTDFDFDENLPEFDEAAAISPQTQNQNNQNLLQARPEPRPPEKKFCTDSGLLVSSVSYDSYKRLLAAAELHGLSVERRLEVTGVCASQMALTLLGGPNRLTPKNWHQRPQVVLLCGPHLQGAQGLSCGRHLANHQVEVILFLPNFVKMQESITNEVTLFNQTNSRHVRKVRDLPATPVDLIISCLDSHENTFLREQPWYRAATDWANQNRAPVLSIDPPVRGCHPSVEAKWLLCLGLPLSHPQGEGRIYLCDVGLPQRVFQDVGIDYVSPFGSKFVIPLYSV